MESHSAPQSAPSPTGSTVGGSARTVVARSALDDLLVLLRAGGDADAQRACIGAGIGGDGDNPPAVPPGDLARKAAELASRLR